MAVLVRMPEVLANVEEAAIQSWLVSEGDAVGTDTPLAEIETEKAMVEFNSEHEGTIVELLISAGETVAVGTPIAILKQEGDSDADIDAIRPSGSAEPAQPAAQEAETASAEAGTQAAPSSAPVETGAAPAASAVAQTEADAPTDSGDRIFSSPIVRRLAKERGLDLSTVQGTGPGGRIVRRDIDGLEAQAAAPAAPAAAPAEAPLSDDLGGEVVALTGMRKAIARRLTESKSTVPHFYLTANCRVDDLLALRKQVNEAAPRKISVNDFVVKAAAGALKAVPDANAIWGGDHIRKFDTADIAVAVSTDGGLLTPVVRGVDTLSLTALSETIADMAGRAREGRLKQHELEGGSFSISNLGMYGVDEFSAILNPPQSGILAVGAAQQKPIVVDGELAVGTIMSVTLSADHRVVDGALAAEWLAAFKRLIEQPMSILV